MSDSMVPVTVIFGVPVERLTWTLAMDVIDQLVADGRVSGRSHQIATVNVDFLVNAISSQELLSLLQNTSLNLADGMPLLWAGRLLGTPVPERVTGADLVPRLAAESERRGWRIHLLGGGPGVADRARAILLSNNPGAMITADAGPKLSDDVQVHDDVIASIRSSGADILCVAFGNPKQERFIAAIRDRLGCPVMIGVGGSLDMVVGDRRRAPAWMQRAGLEWVVRAAQEPKRLGRRYGHDARVFGPKLLRYRRVVLRYERGPASPEQLDVEQNGGVLRVNVDGVDELSPSAHADLCAIVRSAQRSGYAVRCGTWSDQLRRCLDDFGTRTWFERVMLDENDSRRVVE